MVPILRKHLAAIVGGTTSAMKILYAAIVTATIKVDVSLVDVLKKKSQNYFRDRGTLSRLLLGTDRSPVNIHLPCVDVNFAQA